MFRTVQNLPKMVRIVPIFLVGLSSRTKDVEWFHLFLPVSIGTAKECCHITTVLYELVFVYYL